jgi:hypothetical protein
MFREAPAVTLATSRWAGRGRGRSGAGAVPVPCDEYGNGNKGFARRPQSCESGLGGVPCRCLRATCFQLRRTAPARHPSQPRFTRLRAPRETFIPIPIFIARHRHGTGSAPPPAPPSPYSRRKSDCGRLAKHLFPDSSHVTGTAPAPLLPQPLPAQIDVARVTAGASQNLYSLAYLLV